MKISKALISNLSLLKRKYYELNVILKKLFLKKSEKPTITIYTLCFNEELIIPYFINHYSQFVEKIVVYDNQSSDNSVKILSEYQKKFNIEINTLDTDYEFREDILTETRNECWKGDKSDFVIVCDMDELIHHDDLVTFLNQYRNFDYFQPIGYDMYSLNFEGDTSRQIYNIVNQGKLDNLFSKMVLFNPKTVKETNFEPGSHNANFYPKNLKKYASTGDLKLLHFKNIDLDFVIRRYNSVAMRMNPSPQVWGNQYKWDKQKIIDNFLKNLAECKPVL